MQTGSVRVAVSQSNTLIYGPKIVSNESEKNGQSGGRVSLNSVDRNGQSGEHAKMRNVPNIIDVSVKSKTKSNAISRALTSQQEHPKGGPRSSKWGGEKTGSFASIFEGAKMQKGGGVTGTSSKSKFIQKCSNTTPRKLNITYKGVNEGSYTPTKRKLLLDNNIQNLIGIFDTKPDSKLPGGGDSSESPAKRGRWAAKGE